MMDYADKGSVFPICYMPPIAWFAGVIREKTVRIEVCQHYRKQAYTNRAYVRVSNRVMPLTIPVTRRGRKIPIKDKKISYQEDWQRQHWRSILFAYTHSPYFEFYRDRLEPFYTKKYVFLFDYLKESQEMLFGLLKVSVSCEFTDEFFPPSHYEKDFREAFDPKRKSLPSWFTSVPYSQVFDGFFQNLSILDLLCNEGPESLQILRKSIKNDS